MAKRELSDAQRRQKVIYIELESLVELLQSVKDPEDTHPLDKSRLVALEATDPTAPSPGEGQEPAVPPEKG